jgi:serine protease
LKVGSTKATVKASDGTKQDFFITVRKNDSWM